MNAAFVGVAALMVGIDVGWQPLPDGGLEYIIQIEPQTVDSLIAGEEFFSDLPPEVRDVRSYRIKVGTEKLPRKLETEADRAPTSAANPADKPPSLAPEETGPKHSFLGGQNPFRRLDTAETGARRPRSRFSIGAAAPEASEKPNATTPLPKASAEAEERKPAPAWPSPATRLDTVEQPPAAATGPSPQDDVSTTANDRPASRFSGSPIPRTLNASEKSKPLPEKQAVFVEPAGSESDAATDRATDAAETNEEQPKPWAPLMATLVALFGSLGANVYLAWIAWEARARYRQLTERYFSGERWSSEENAPTESEPNA